MKAISKGPAGSSAGSAAAVADQSIAPKPPKRDRELVSIELKSIEPHPDNPRGKITEADVVELAESIRQLGLLSPIGVIRLKGDKFQCLYGHRRLVALRVAGKTSSECVVFDSETTADIAEAAMLADNAQHVAPDPIAEANVVGQLAKRGTPEAEIARLTGKSPRWVSTRIALSRLPTRILTATLRPKNGDPWSLLALEELAHEPDEKRQQMIVDGYRYGSPHHQTVRDAVMQDKRRLSLAPWKLDDATLCPKAGACSGCPKTSASMGALFHDEERDAKGNVSALCMNGDCWNEKLDAHMNSELARIEAVEGKPLPLAIHRDADNSLKVMNSDRRKYQPHEFSPKKDQFHKKAIDVAIVGPTGVRAAKVFVSDSSSTSAKLPRGQKPKKKISDMKPAEAKAAREERAMQRARSASLETIIALAREVAEPDQSQAIAAAFLFGGRTHGCDEGAYHRPHDKDAKARPTVLKAMSSKGQEAQGGLADACLALWRDAIDQAERITKRRDSQQIKYAITAAQDLAVLIGEDFEAIARTKREEIDGKAKNKPSTQSVEKKPKSAKS